MTQKSLSEALHEFQNTYPSVTSADLQTFILGWNAAEKELTKEMRTALSACFMYSSANNQGLSSIAGKTFGEKIDTVILAVRANSEKQGLVSILERLEKTEEK